MLRRTFLYTLAFFLLCSPNAFAQSPEVEVFGGYTYARHGPVNLNGWNVSFASNLNTWASVIADLGGHYYDEDDDFFGTPISGDVGAYTYRFGPKFRIYATPRVTPFVQTLLGGAFVRITNPFQDPTDFNGLAAAAGGGVDVNLTDRLAVRAVQADYGLVRIQTSNSTGLRLSFGLVFKFY